MNLSKEHFDMYNEYTLNINKIKREVNAIIKRQRFTARRCKRASEEEILDLEINKYEEVESINKTAAENIYNYFKSLPCTTILASLNS